MPFPRNPHAAFPQASGPRSTAAPMDFSFEDSSHDGDSGRLSLRGNRPSPFASLGRSRGGADWLNGWSGNAGIVNEEERERAKKRPHVEAEMDWAPSAFGSASSSHPNPSSSAPFLFHSPPSESASSPSFSSLSNPFTQFSPQKKAFGMPSHAQEEADRRRRNSFSSQTEDWGGPGPAEKGNEGEGDTSIQDISMRSDTTVPGEEAETVSNDKEAKKAQGEPQPEGEAAPEADTSTSSALIPFSLGGLGGGSDSSRPMSNNGVAREKRRRERERERRKKRDEEDDNDEGEESETGSEAEEDDEISFLPPSKSPFRRRPQRSNSPSKSRLGRSNSGSNSSFRSQKNFFTLHNHHHGSFNSGQGRGQGADGPHGMVERTAAWLRGETPYVLLGYIQLLFNASLVGFALYFLFFFFKTVQKDMSERVDEAGVELRHQIFLCSQQYMINKCEPGLRIPAMEKACMEWESCMNRDPKVVGRARLGAETFADVVNGFVDVITWKTMLFILASLTLTVYATNTAIGSFRHKLHPSYPLHHQPSYSHHPPPLPHQTSSGHFAATSAPSIPPLQAHHSWSSGASFHNPSVMSSSAGPSPVGTIFDGLGNPYNSPAPGMYGGLTGGEGAMGMGLGLGLAAPSNEEEEKRETTSEVAGRGKAEAAKKGWLF